MNNMTQSAYFYAIVGKCVLGIMQAAIKVVNSTLSTFQLVFIRSLCIFLITWCLARKQNLPIYVRSRPIFLLLLLRMAAMNMAVIMMFQSLTYLPVSTTSTLYNLSPIFMFFIQAIYYRRPLKKIGLVLTLFSFVGVILIIQPHFIFGQSNESPIDSQEFIMGVILVILAALAFSFNMLFVHFIGKAIPSTVFVLQSNVGLIIVTGLFCTARPNPLGSEDFSWQLVGGIAIIVLTGLINQKCQVIANSMVRPSVIMPFGYLSVVVAFLIDFYLFETRFSALTLLGIMMTSLGLLGNYLIEKSERKAQIQKVYRPEQDKKLNIDGRENFKAKQKVKYSKQNNIQISS